jgi:hypothetical protein
MAMTMSTEQDKFKHSKRMQRDENAVKKQTRIAKQYGSSVEEPHRFVKHHAMNCGDPNCVMCANPRKIFKEPTQQEKRLFQDLDQVRGTPPTDPEQ